MKGSKLYSILEYFDKYEQNRLRKFVNSPYFNKNEAIIQLLDSLLDHINSNKTTEIEKEDIWVKLYAGNSFDDVLFRKNCSDLLKLIESFLAQQVYEENPIYKANFLLEAIAERKINKLYNSSIRTTRRLSAQQLYKTADYYFGQYKLERNLYSIKLLEQKRADKLNVEDILNNLDRFYLSEKLRYSSSVLSHTSLVSHEYKLLFLEEIAKHIEKIGYDDVPPVAIYYQIYLTQTQTETEDHYYKLKKLLEQYGDYFPKNEAEFIYLAALNYCVRKLNTGNRRFLEEYFKMSEILLNKELLMPDGELNPWQFKNIVVAALRLGKYNWTENFIKKFSAFLPESKRENAVSFNSAQLYMYQKKFDKVIDILQIVDYEDMTYNLNSKVMLMSAYYETDEIEPLYSLMDSFRTFLNRHKDFAASHRMQYTKLIQFTKKLTKIMPSDKKAIKKLKAEVTQAEEKGIASINWLKEKITELE